MKCMLCKTEGPLLYAFLVFSVLADVSYQDVV